MEKEKLLRELRESFEKLKKELKFKATFNEINSISFIEDMVLKERYVSEQFSRQLINRMIDTFANWVPFLHSFIVPQPYDTITLNEIKQLNQLEKQEILSMISKIIYLVRKNKRIGFEANRSEEGKFIDELAEFDKKQFTPFMVKLHKKFEQVWKDQKK